MWLGACCLFSALLMAIIGVSVDILMIEQGQIYDIYEITVDYGWQEMTWSGNIELVNATRTLAYSTAYNEYCTGTESSSFCNALADLRDGGRVYIAFNIIGIILLTVSLALAILGSLGKCCARKCRLHWIVAILCTLSMICFIIAFGVFIANFSENVNTVFDTIFHTSFFNWQGAYIGGSISCLIIATSLGLITLSCVLCIDRRANVGQVYAPLYDSAPPGFASTSGAQPIYAVYPQPPPMYVPYGQPPPAYVPYGEPNPNEGYTVPTNYQPQNPNITPV